MTILQFDKLLVLGKTFAPKIQIFVGEALLITANWYLETELKFDDKIQFYAQFYNLKCRTSSTKNCCRIECRIEI